MEYTSPTFNDKCYELLKNVPKGSVTTYKIIARALNTNAYRAVGNAMKRNQNLLNVPCHRVVNSNGSVGEYILGTEKKIEILKSEGIEITNGKIVDFNNRLFKF
ncbi:methylated-DNA--protein-cysteine methyltransferase [Methanococcus vannielii SB]|uniref:Methylated-DNA--protein-cysteine methyltransferase n=1 Tax=Methanococcus vannielii (strain ATCC 35089 / DSM 1224 / JCM 13029 / OCM 148 / SB) TaxID=406327 RepID=A6UR60_METVS|nr:MGMT family protein [Methanococcus vannielii]ABR54982.1 methylated-DNA--protein-cysteine methyltransferase [Methanococcus vannielii SB]